MVAIQWRRGRKSAAGVPVLPRIVPGADGAVLPNSLRSLVLLLVVSSAG